MPITFVNSCSGGGTQNGVTSSAMDTTGANLIIVSVASFRQNTASNLTDSESNTYIALSTVSSNPSGSVARAMNRLFFCIAPTTSSSHTFTFSESNTYPSISAIAFSGVSAYESENTSSQTGTSTTIRAGSVTPNNDGSLIIAGAASDGGVYTNLDSGFTLETSESYLSGQHQGCASAYFIQTTAAAVNPEFTNSVSDYLAASIAVFKPAKTGLGDEKLWLCPSLDDSANDISGNGNHGTYQGGMGTVADTSNGGTRAYSFDGSNDYIDCGTPITNTSFSMSAWFNADNSFSKSMAGSYHWQAGERSFYVRIDNGFAEFLIASIGNSSSGNVKITSSSSISSGTWYHIAATWDSVSGAMELFIDGSSVGTANQSAMASPIEPLAVGAYSSIEGFFNGKQDDIRFFDRALTTTEITSLASKRGYQVPQGAGPFPHPLTVSLKHPLG